MSRLVWTLLLISFTFSSFAQIAIDNAIFRKIRNESYAEAISYGNKKLAELKEPKKVYRKAISYHLGLGLVYKKTGNFAEAERHYEEALRILKEKDEKGIRRKLVDYDVLDELASLYLETGNFFEAEDLIKKSISEREERFDKTNLLRYRSYLVYGNFFFRTNEFDSAYDYFKKYIFYIKNSRHTSKEELNRYADTYRLLTEMELRKKDITQALVFAKKNKHLQFHPWTKKEAGKNNLNKILSLNLLSECYRMLGNEKLAEKYSKQSFDLYHKVILTESFDIVPLLMNRGFMSWNKGLYEEAEKDFIKAAELQSTFLDKNFKYLSEYEKENFYTSLKENFEVLNSFALDKHLRDDSPASDTLWNTIYNYQIKTKGIILNESNKMMELIQKSNDPELSKQFSEWRSLKNELSKKIIVEGLNENNPATKELKQSINHLEKEMSRKTSLFSDSVAKDISWKNIRSSLKAEEAAIEILRVRRYDSIDASNTAYKKFKGISNKYKGLSDSVTYLFLIVKSNSPQPEVVIAKEGNLMEGKYYNYFRNANILKVDDRKSYGYYWEPLEEKLKSYSTIYVSSEGVYNLINLWILKNPLSNKYLIDEVTIVNLTNTRQVLTYDKKKFDIESVLLLGRPNYAHKDSVANGGKGGNNLRSFSSSFRAGVNDLPGTEEEVQSIADYLTENKVNSKVLLWNDASEDILKDSESHHILHIATHGFFDANEKGRNPMLRSGLLLAGVTGIIQSGKEDGLLTAYEASNLDLQNTSLVVLSACETGLGEIRHGEGVYGLQRAFEVAGVHAILMSMWKVNDQTTQELMSAFYEELLKSKNIINAFRTAQIRIRDKYPDRLYWGAFKLVGN